MDSDEFCLWLAEYDRKPWGDVRFDAMGAVIASTVANYAGKSRKPNAPPAELIEFMPFCQPKPVESNDDYESLKAFFGEE